MQTGGNLTRDIKSWYLTIRSFLIERSALKEKCEFGEQNSCCVTRPWIKHLTGSLYL